MSTSLIKNISGDKKLNFFKKIYWFLIAYINLLNLNKKKIILCKQEKLILNKKIAKTNNINTNLSPIRNLCNLFWLSLNWKEIKHNFKNINCIEVGCGSGRYGILIKKLLGKNFLTYTGIDISNKKFFNKKNFFFYKDNSNNIKKYLTKKNFLVTQSAIEHFENDKFFFETLSRELNRSRKKFLQIHLVPSNHCLKTYLFHGYRHYDIFKISKMISSFNKRTSCYLIPIGSKNMNKLTFKKVTLPRIFKINSKITKKEILKSIIQDQNSNIFEPSFYAFILMSNFKLKKIFR